MPEIPFTQFLRPDGRRKDTWIDMPVEVELQARRFIEEGGSYTSEILPGNDVSLCAEFTVDGERQDVVCIIVLNGPDVVAGVTRLVYESYEFLQKIGARDE